MVKSYKFWCAVFGALLALSAAALLWLPRLGGGHVARISSHGQVVREVDLALVTEPYEFTVTSPEGYNVIRVERGRIRVVESDCPDLVCCRSGAISGAARPILCLPHALCIEILSGDAADALTPDVVAGGGA